MRPLVNTPTAPISPFDYDWLVELFRWNTATALARASYYNNPLAASRAEIGEMTCWNCKNRRHHKCVTRANHGLALCTCWLDNDYHRAAS